MLLLGSTGAVLKPSNLNPGIASVASVTLEKLVVPLKVLNISDNELRLLREIVLFNPGTLDKRVCAFTFACIQIVLCVCMC